MQMLMLNGEPALELRIKKDFIEKIQQQWLQDYNIALTNNEIKIKGE